VEPTESARGSTEQWATLGLFMLIAALVGGDLVEDARAGGGALHLGAEVLATALAGLGAGALFIRLLRQRRRAQRAQRDAEEQATAARGRADSAEREAARWRDEARAALAGLGVEIDRQLRRWALTPAESEVAMLLLKGLSTKEIASIRDTADRTVRQQARTVYAKAGLSGRAELSAFFLEDLLLPHP
jgi:DNA-binding CsgD family transcriptional regulator